MSYEDIIVDRDGDVETITINRPEAKNSLTYRTYAEMEQAVRATTARCLVVTGSDGALVPATTSSRSWHRPTTHRASDSPANREPPRWPTRCCTPTSR